MAYFSLRQSKPTRLVENETRNKSLAWTGSSEYLEAPGHFQPTRTAITMLGFALDEKQDCNKLLKEGFKHKANAICE